MKSLKNKVLVLASLVLLISAKVQAADDVELNKIVITASRFAEDSGDVTRNMDSVNSGEIDRSQGTDLTGVLTDLTSVNISDYGSAGATKTIRMRGSSAAQVLVMVDGRPINSPRDGQADLSSIPLDDIQRVEVMHGPGSSLYGAGAMGGTVNIITKNPPKEKQKTEIYSSFGTFRTYDERFSHGARIAKFGYLVSGGYQSSEGSRPNSEFNANDFNSKFEYEIADNNKLTFNSGYYRSRMGTPGLITSPDLDDKQRDLKNYQDLGWVLGLDETTQVSTRVFQNYDRLEFIENTAGASWESANSKDVNTTRVRGYDFQLSKKLFEIYQGIFGFNYVTNLNDSSTSAKHEYTVRAAYLENKLDLFDEHLKFDFGARVDDYSNFGTQINPSFSFLYEFNNRLKFLGSISRSFRAPTFNDLYWPDQGDGTKGNPDLRPEKGWTKEIGLETQVCKYLTTGLTYYRSDYKQLINWTPDATGYIWTPTNVASAVIDGIEFENKIKFNDKLGFDLGYTYLRAKNDDTHKYLVYQPKHKIDFSLKYKELNGFICELKGQFTDKRYYNAENTIKVKQFFVLGFNVSKKFSSGVTCFASIDNMLNRTYQVMRDYPMPGFAFTGGAKWEF